MIKIDQLKCNQCNICTQYCPVEIIAKGPAIKEEIHKHCVNCGHCYSSCPEGAIELTGFEVIEIPDYSHDLPVSPEQMESLLRRRRSVRHYKSQPVSKEHLEKIIESGYRFLEENPQYAEFKQYIDICNSVQGQRWIDTALAEIKAICTKERISLTKDEATMMINEFEARLGFEI